jgi:hypothetical protein
MDENGLRPHRGAKAMLRGTTLLRRQAAGLMPAMLGRLRDNGPAGASARTAGCPWRVRRGPTASRTAFAVRAHAGLGRAHSGHRLGEREPPPPPPGRTGPRLSGRGVAGGGLPSSRIGPRIRRPGRNPSCALPGKFRRTRAQAPEPARCTRDGGRRRRQGRSAVPAPPVGAAPRAARQGRPSGPPVSRAPGRRRPRPPRPPGARTSQTRPPRSGEPGPARRAGAAPAPIRPPRGRRGAGRRPP